MIYPTQANVDSHYGNPRGLNGKVNPKWLKANIVYIAPPWLMKSPNGGRVQFIACHYKLASVLHAIFNEIWNHFGRDQAKIDAIGMSTFDGSYVYREKRNGNGLSMHSYGIAFDFDAGRNAYGSHKMSMDKTVVAVFEKHGATWGGRWEKPDGMHFQFARVK